MLHRCSFSNNVGRRFPVQNSFLLHKSVRSYRMMHTAPKTLFFWTFLLLKTFYHQNLHSYKNMNEYNHIRGVWYETVFKGKVQNMKCPGTEWITKLTWVRKWVIEKQQIAFVLQTIWKLKTFLSISYEYFLKFAELNKNQFFQKKFSFFSTFFSAFLIYMGPLFFLKWPQKGKLEKIRFADVGCYCCASLLISISAESGHRTLKNVPWGKSTS